MTVYHADKVLPLLLSVSTMLGVSDTIDDKPLCHSLDPLLAAASSQRLELKSKLDRPWLELRCGFPSLVRVGPGLASRCLR